MTDADKLDRIIDIVQRDPGDRGLARDPAENLFTATRGDFRAACLSIASRPDARVEIVTGFFIPSAEPSAFETDGPLGAWLLAEALGRVGIPAWVRAEPAILRAIDTALTPMTPTHRVAVERSGPAKDGRHYTMRGIDIAPFLDPALTALFTQSEGVVTVGVGDGGNEIGMGKLSTELIRRNIPSGELVRCTVATDYLIAAGVSNWGAYALAAGVTLLRGKRWPVEWADSAFHRGVLAEQVGRGPLVDGVTLKFEPTVDGIPWDEYHRVLEDIDTVMRG